MQKEAETYDPRRRDARATLYVFTYNLDMDVISFSVARAKLASTLDHVCANHEPVIVTRQGGESVVIISLADYEQLDETAHLKRSPKNARRLTEAIARLDAGFADEHELVD